MNIKCPGCAAENKEGAKFCKGCGTSFASLVTCPACSVLVKPGKFCPSCGHNFSAPPPQVEEKPSAEVIEASDTNAKEPAIAAPIEATVIDVDVAQVPPSPPPPPPPIFVAPIVEVKVPAPPEAPVVPVVQQAPTGSKASAVTPGQQERKTNLTLVYALIPLVIVMAGGIYWWKSNSAPTATPVSETVTSSVETQAPAVAPPPPSIPTPVAPPAAEPAPTPAPEPKVPEAPQPEPAAAPVHVPVAKAVPAAPVAPVKAPVVKPEPTKVPVTSAKPDVAAKNPSVVNAPAASVQPAVRAEAPKSASPAKTLDALYQDRITAECPQGFFPGFACREKVRWQMCEGKWSPDAIAGQTTCKGSGSK